MVWKNEKLAILAGLLLLIAAFLLYKFAYPWYAVNKEASILSAIVLVGLGITILLIAVLAITFRVLGYDNGAQALGLPEGSIRALLAFSLVLIFVCLSAFLYSESTNRQCARNGSTLDRVSTAELAQMKENFVTASQQATDGNGKPLYEQKAAAPPPKPPAPARTPRKGRGRQAPNPPPTPPGSTSATSDDLTRPLYRVTYYPKEDKEAGDFARQIFTTLATVFISVVSFYFGSSVTSSAVKTGAATANYTPPPPNPNQTPQTPATPPAPVAPSASPYSATSPPADTNIPAPAIGRPIDSIDG